MENEKKVTIKNLGEGTHIFGAVHVHPEKNGKPDHTQQPVCLHQAETLNPGGSIEMTPSQFKFYEDDAMVKRINSGEFDVIFNGVHARPGLAKKVPATQELKATESAATQEASVLAEIMAESAPKPTE